MRKIVVTFTIALSLGAASTIANAQPAAPATNASAAASTTAAANNNQTTAAKTSTPAAAQSSAAASSSAPAVVPPKGDNKSDKDPSADKDKQSNKDKSGNNVGSTLGIIAAIAAVLGLVGGGIFWAIQQNLIPNIQLPNIPGLPTNIPNPFAPPAPAPAPAPTSSAAPAPAE